MSLIIVADVDENDIVAGANAGAGASDVVFVRDITDRPLSRNSTIALVSVIGLYRLSVSGPSVFLRIKAQECRRKVLAFTYIYFFEVNLIFAIALFV